MLVALALCVKLRSFFALIHVIMTLGVNSVLYLAWYWAVKVKVNLETELSQQVNSNQVSQCTDYRVL